MSSGTIVKAGAAEAKTKKPAKGFLSSPIGSSKPSSSKAVIFGASPRADLLPPEVLQRNKDRARQRALWLGVVAVAVLVVAASGGAAFLALTSQQNLVTSQTLSTQLLQDQAKHSEVRDIKANVATAEDAQRVGTSTEIDWKSYLLALQATLPAGVLITSVDSQVSTPTNDIQQSTTPLQGARVGTLTFSAISPELPSIPAWLNGLTTLKGFVDAVPNSVTLNENGTYTVSITMHINGAAYLGRFAQEAGK